MPAQGRSFIESYPDSVKRLEPKFSRNYRFITNPIREQMFTINNSMLLLNQMVKNIKGREAQGKDQQATWDAIQSLINDSEEGKEANLASSSIEMYRQLLVEANSQL